MIGRDHSGEEPVIPAMTVGTRDRLGTLSSERGQITLVTEKQRKYVSESQQCQQMPTEPTAPQYGELELEKKEAMAFHQACEDQEASGFELLWAHGKHQLAGPRTDGNSWSSLGAVMETRGLSLIVSGH